MKKIIIAILILGVAGVVWKLWPQQNLNWQTYQNTVYGYSIQYPSLISSPSSNNEYSGSDLTDEFEIDFGVPGKTTIFGIELDYLTPELAKRFRQDASETEIIMITEREKLLSMDLKSYVEALREMQITNPNTNSRAEVGEMREVIIYGKTAYEFSLTNGFKLPTGEYSLGDGQTYNYVITENLKGQKIIIRYLIGSTTYPEGVKIARKMLESFKSE